MAVVTFGGSTLWNNATTGISRVSVFGRGGANRWVAEDLPGGNGGLLKFNGRAPGLYRVVCRYYADDDEQRTIFSAWEAVRGAYGTVSYPAGESSDSLTFCALMDIEKARQGEQVQRIDDNDVIDAYTIVATFSKLRWD